jgi:5-methyltetrahydrofolate--homocysteine methyltransferase
VVNFFEAAMEKWHGRVVVSMVDLGGVMDVLQTFRGAENLLMDLYDSPDEVLRCIREIQSMWLLCYRKLNAIMESEAEGYSDWWLMYGEKPGYILQSDFSYMIGPDMFRTFVAPELSSTAASMTNAVYHMDGIGQIPHLDQILSIDGIKGIQWVPGSGTPEEQNWDWILERILASGKKLIHLAQKPDGSPIDLAKNPGQLYFGARGFHAQDTEGLRRYAGMYGLDLR